MKYEITLGDKYAQIMFSDDLNKEDIDLVKNMLNQALDNRKIELKKLSANKLSLSDDIRDLYPPLSQRTLNVLLRANYKTIGDVLNSTFEELMNVRNMGKKSFEEIRNAFLGSVLLRSRKMNCNDNCKKFCHYAVEIAIENEANKTCFNCRYSHRLKHNYVKGKGYEESYCCDVLLRTMEKPRRVDATWIQEVSPNDICEMYEEGCKFENTVRMDSKTKS